MKIENTTGNQIIFDGKVIYLNTPLTDFVFTVEEFKDIKIEGFNSIEINNKTIKLKK